MCKAVLSQRSQKGTGFGMDGLPLLSESSLLRAFPEQPEPQSLVTRSLQLGCSGELGKE